MKHPERIATWFLRELPERQAEVVLGPREDDEAKVEIEAPAPAKASEIRNAITALSSERRDGPIRQDELVKAVRKRLEMKTAGEHKIIEAARHCGVAFFGKGHPKKIPE